MQKLKFEIIINVFENYYFESLEENVTKLSIELDGNDKYAEMFNEMWPKGLAILKDLCER